MAPVSDLVRDSKLDTQFDPRYTQHVFYVSGLTPQRRKVRKEQRWVREKTIGTGGGGTVWLEKLAPADEGDIRLRAVKEIRKEPQPYKFVDYGRELEAMAKFSNPRYEMCFVKFFGWYESLDANTIFIAMEYFKYGDLQRHLKSPLVENEAQQIMMQLLEGLVFMHDNGFAHRDLKPANIFVVSVSPNWWIKIGDFGISKRTEEGRTDLRSFAGTPGFLAPEVLGHIDADADEKSSAYTHAVDIWSAGEITFRILVGEAPFQSMSTLGLYARGLMTFPTGVLLSRSVSQSACDFVKNLMAPRAKNRLSAEEALAHVWLRSEVPLEDSSPSGTDSLHAIDHLALNTIEEQDPPSSDPKSLSAENNPFSVASGSWSTFAEEPAEKPAEKPNNPVPLPEVPSQGSPELGRSKPSKETTQVAAVQNQPKTLSEGLAPGSLSRNWKHILQDTDYVNFGTYNCPFTGCLFSQGTAFDTSEALVQHISKSHGRINRPPYHCIVNSCPLVSQATFQSPEKLATHLQMAHKSGSGTYLCPVQGCQFAQGSGFAGHTALSMHLKDAHSIVPYANTKEGTMDGLSISSSTSALTEAILRVRFYVGQAFRPKEDLAEYLRKLDGLAIILRAVELRQDEIRTKRPWDQSLKNLYPRNNRESALSQLEQTMKRLEAKTAPSGKQPFPLRWPLGRHWEAVDDMFAQVVRNCEKIQYILDQGSSTPSKR